MNLLSVVTAICLVTTTGAGCLGKPDGEQVEIQWGMGLDLPATLPPPGSFPPGYERLDEFNAFVLNISARTLDECQRSQRIEEVRYHLEQGFHRQALIAGGVCAATHHAGVEDMVKRYQAAGNETEVWEALRAEARAALDAWKVALANQPSPGTYLEIEVANILMNDEVDMESYYRLALGNRDEYNESKAFAALMSSYLNLYDPIDRSRFTIAFLNEFPWSTGCMFRQDDLRNAASSLAERLHDISAEKNPDDSLNSMGTVRGDLEFVTWPKLNYSIEQGWWEKVLVEWWNLRHNEQIWANWDATVLPSNEEATYLIAKFRNETRFLLGDNRAWVYQGWVNQGKNDWTEPDENEEDAKRILALPALKPDWSFVTCPNGS